MLYEVITHIIFFKGGCEQKGTSFIPAGSKWYWINFKYENIQLEHENISIPLPKKFQLPIQNNIISIIREMENLYNSNLSYKHERLNAFLYQIFFEILSAKEQGINNFSTKQIAPKVIKILNNQLSTKFSATEISDELEMNYSYLGRLFKKETGMSINKYYLKLKINLAIQLLYSTNMNISQISEHLNFPNPYYFSRVFKQVTGYAPVNYQRQFNFQNIKDPK